MPLDIEVGQRWVTRSGKVVEVTADRGPFAMVERWRWALSNGQIVDRDGRCDAEGPHECDLIRLAASEPGLSDVSTHGMDSTMGGLSGQ